MKETMLMISDDADRLRVVSTRLAQILEPKVESEPRPAEYSLVKTRFDSSENYLWQKCRYFEV